MCYSPAPAPACRQPGLVTVPAPRAGVAWGPPSITGLGDPQNGQTATPRAALGEIWRNCAQPYWPPPERVGGCPYGKGSVCPHALGTPHCPQHCCPGVGTHRDVPLGHVAISPWAISCPLPAHPATLRTITSPAPAHSVCLSWGAGNEPPRALLGLHHTPLGAGAAPPLGLSYPDPPPHPPSPPSRLSMRGGAGGWRGMCRHQPRPGRAPSVTRGDMSSFHCYSHPESLPLSPGGSPWPHQTHRACPSALHPHPSPMGACTTLGWHGVG